MDERGFTCMDDIVGKAIPAYSEWGNLNLDYETVAKIDADRYMGCNRLHGITHDSAHQCIHPNPLDSIVPVVDESECVGCNLCEIVCPVEDCISMVPVNNGFPEKLSWNDHILNDGKNIRPKKVVMVTICLDMIQ